MLVVQHHDGTTSVAHMFWPCFEVLSHLCGKMVVHFSYISNFGGFPFSDHSFCERSRHSFSFINKMINEKQISLHL